MEGELEKQHPRNPSRFSRRWFAFDQATTLLKFWRLNNPEEVFFIDLKKISGLRRGFDDVEASRRPGSSTL